MAAEERPEFLLDDDALMPAAAAGFHAAGVALVEALISTGPDAAEFLRLVRARVRAGAVTSPPPESATGILRDRWQEVAIGAIDHIFAHGGIDREN